MGADVIEIDGRLYKRVATEQSTSIQDRGPRTVNVDTGLTVYLGGAGMTGGYIHDQVNSLKAVGISGSVVGRNTEGQYVDALAGVTKHRTRIKTINGMGNTGPYVAEADWSLSSLNVSHALPRVGQFNLIGYSFGSLVAAQSALYYADKGRSIDHLVLIGSPISQEMLNESRQHPNIKNVIVLDLKDHGDPIYAGMSLVELVGSSTLLMTQMNDSTSRQEGVGHFYYGIDGESGKQRRLELARYLYDKGLR